MLKRLNLPENTKRAIRHVRYVNIRYGDPDETMHKIRDINTWSVLSVVDGPKIVDDCVSVPGAIVIVANGVVAIHCISVIDGALTETLVARYHLDGTFISATHQNKCITEALAEASLSATITNNSLAKQWDEIQYVF